MQLNEVKNIMDNIIFESPSKRFIREHQEEWKAEGRAEGWAEVQHELEEKNKIIEKLEAELKKIKALFPDLEKSYWLARKAMKEYNRLGKTVSRKILIAISFHLFTFKQC